MGLKQKSKNISLCIDDVSLSRLDYVCGLMSIDYGFKITRTKAINKLVSDYLEKCNIDEIESKQIRLSAYV